ncbi:Uma2 family endonuclease [Streptomyces sp. NPDC051162]|uniref:Uma2 family endonuclease n=1 Tax=unclassified Streptomyces TaxID=2593676 RepID=UPI00342FD5CA
MTAVDEDIIALIEEHPEIFERYKVELLRGEIVMMSAPGKVHNMNVLFVQRQIPSDRWYPLQTQDIAIPGEASEPVPDLVVVGPEEIEESSRIIPAPAVTLVMEVVSKSSVYRDYSLKSSIYAAGQVPAYLIVDPIKSSCLLLTEPTGAGDEASYLYQRTCKFGDPLHIEVLDLTLDTSMLRSLPST